MTCVACRDDTAVATDSRNFWQNIALALGIKTIFLLLAILTMPACGWQCLPTWEPVCWWCLTVCVCLGLAQRWMTATQLIPSRRDFARPSRRILERSEGLR